MLRKRPDIRTQLVAEGVQVTVLSPTDQLLDVPELKWLARTPTDTPNMGWNERARGGGGTLETPITSCSEENLLCMPCDRDKGGNLLVHEFAHTIELVGLARDSAFRRGLDDAFANATAKNLFQSKYLSNSKHEYWAAGVQSWFDANDPSERRSRAELIAVDPPLAALVTQVFPDDEWRFSCGLVEEPPATPGPHVHAPPVGPPHACAAGMASLPGGVLPFDPATVVQPFCMDTTEVTVEAYAACVRAGRCTPAATKISQGAQPALNAYCNGDRPDRQHHPVNCVDWKQATTYCKGQGKRLPTEQEWEWAARGARKAPFPWGVAPPRDQLCWSGVAAQQTTCEVGTFTAGDTPQGIHDLAGNVREWTASTLAAGNPIVKGSSFNDEQAVQVRVSRRDGGPPDLRTYVAGFRCVR
jgi:hypothetical protein